MGGGEGGVGGVEKDMREEKEVVKGRMLAKYIARILLSYWLLPGFLNKITSILDYWIKQLNENCRQK